MSTSILVVITDILLEAEIANVTVNDTGQYTVDGLRSGVAYSFELFVALQDLQLYGQNSASVIGATLLGKLSVMGTVRFRLSGPRLSGSSIIRTPN